MTVRYTRWLWVACLALAVPGCEDPLAVSAEFEEGFFESAGVRLHYVMDFPTGEGPFPFVVLGHGSGPKTIRDYGGFTEGLLAAGLGTLRFDRRGAGDSGGEYLRLGQVAAAELFPVLAGDIARAVETAVADPRVDPTRLGLFGESQAGWVLPLAASEAPAVSYLVLLSGPTVDVGLNIKYEDLTQDLGLTPLDAEARIESEGFVPDWDPRPFLDGFSGASIWIYGDQDALVPPRLSIAILDQLEAEGKDVEYHLLPGHDHGLRPLGSASRVDYWPIVGSWLAARGIPG